MLGYDVQSLAHSIYGCNVACHATNVISVVDRVGISLLPIVFVATGICRKTDHSSLFFEAPTKIA